MLTPSGLGAASHGQWTLSWRLARDEDSSALIGQHPFIKTL
jgi:hypothetical protein